MTFELKRWVRSCAVLVAAFAFASCLQSQTPENSASAQSKPTADLSGVWVQASSVNVEWSDTQGNRLKELPMTSWGSDRYKANRPTHGPRQVPSWQTTDPLAKCLPPGVPGIYMMTFPMEVIQIPGRVMLFFEYDHYVRQIFTDGRDHQIITPTWMGDSTGKWEGDTLVVDVTGFNDRSWLDDEGHPHSEELHIVERLRRLDKQTMEDVITISDPKAYTQSFTTTRKLTLKPGWNIVEFICEDNGTFLDFQKTAGVEKK
jgi:hypothetical protein